MSTATETELARLLASLHREGRQQSGLDPRLVPADKDAAYRHGRRRTRLAGGWLEDRCDEGGDATPAADGLTDLRPGVCPGYSHVAGAGRTCPTVQPRSR